MKILLSSHFFHPSVGGIEEVSRVLAQEFVVAGHEIRIVTSTAGEDGERFPYEVYRRPNPAQLMRLVTWCDVYFHNNISLQTAWPLLLVNRPWVVAHHTWIARMDGTISWRDRLKQFVARNARNISVSSAMSRHISAPTVVIGNPYRDALFRCDPLAVRDRELAFLGRLVIDKGADLLLDALVVLRDRGLTPRLTVIGKGPEQPRLEEQCKRLGLDGQVEFTGVKSGDELVALLNRHRLIVVPSRWQEPFGLVALEGVACGCVAVAARSGGLADAIGNCGVTFRHDNVQEMADRIAELLLPSANLERYRAEAPAHLAQHSSKSVAAQYLRVIEEAFAR